MISKDIFGFVTWVNSILIPYFKIACELNHFESYLVTFAFYISYFVMSVPSSYLLKNVGFKKGMMTGFFLMSTGAFIFIPAAYGRTYELFLLGLFTIGVGLAILQTAANPYITILGPKESAAQRISIMGIFNKGAGIIAPLLFAAVVLKATDTDLFAQLNSMDASQKAPLLDELIRRVIKPYAVVGTVLFCLGLLVRFSPLPEIDTEKESDETAHANAEKKTIFEFYGLSMNMPLLEAKSFPAYVLTATIIGYIIGIATIPTYIRQVNALRICTGLGLVLTFLITLTSQQVHFLGHTASISIWFVVLLGLANSLVWAAIWPLALDGLGRFTKLGASLLIMGLSGNALVPLIYGSIADNVGVQ
ncbi:MAG: MFS transporter, partial [Cyclobacteriaceae bacterium]|nr:MFS transporter [Cyclobacteriaceae bacterium]